MTERLASDQKVADPGSIRELVRRRRGLEKTITLILFGAKLFTCCGGPA